MTALVFGGRPAESGWAEDLICALPRTGPLILSGHHGALGRRGGGAHRSSQGPPGREGFFLYGGASPGSGGRAPPVGSAVLLRIWATWRPTSCFPGEPSTRRGRTAASGGGWICLRGGAGHLVVVSGDLFRDGVDYPPETGAYLDLLARLHRDLAARADRVTELVCGLPVHWKGGEV